MVRTKKNPIKYLLMSFILFGVLGCEYLVFFLDRIVDGRSMSDLFSWPIHWYGAVFHWLIIILVWGIISFIVISWLKKQYAFNEIYSFKFNKRTLIISILVVLLVTISAIVEAKTNNQIFPQFINEYKGFKHKYGSLAWLVSIFQNIYYIFEIFIVMLMIICFQKAGEIAFKNIIFPWASIGLPLTWGAIHFLSHPEGALGILIWSILPGIVYLISKRNFYPTYAILFLGFLL